MTATPRSACKKTRVQRRTHIKIRAQMRGSCAYFYILHAALEQPPTVNLGIIVLPIIDQIHDSVQHIVVLEESEGILLVPECEIAHDIAHYPCNLGISSLNQYKHSLPQFMHLPTAKRPTAVRRKLRAHRNEIAQKSRREIEMKRKRKSNVRFQARCDSPRQHWTTRSRSRF